MKFLVQRIRFFPSLFQKLFVVGFNHPKLPSAEIRESIYIYINLLHFWACLATYRMKYGCIIVQFSVALLKVISNLLNFVKNMIVQNFILMKEGLGKSFRDPEISN